MSLTTLSLFSIELARLQIKSRKDDRTIALLRREKESQEEKWTDNESEASRIQSLKFALREATQDIRNLLRWIDETEREREERAGADEVEAGSEEMTILKLEKENQELKGDILSLLKWIEAEREKRLFNKIVES
jgi:hypothetical protein